MYRSVGEFVAALERVGELKRISTPISPVLDISAAAEIESKRPAPSGPSASARVNDPRFHSRGGHALLFQNVEGSKFPLLINAFGSYRRMEMALGCHDYLLGHAAKSIYPEPGSGMNVPNEIHRRNDRGNTPGGFDALGAKIGALAKPQPPAGLADMLAKAKQFLPLLKTPPKRKNGRGPCQEVVLTGDQADLTTLPILRCWPLDGDLASVGYPANVNDGIQGFGSGPEWDAKFRGRYITFAGIHTIHADDADNPRPASHNIGMYRVQLLGKQRAAMHWHIHHDGARHWRSWKAKGKPMPVAIVLGGESVLPYAATAPLPPGVSELLLAGFLNRGGIPLVRGITVPLWIPSNAEIVIEGYVSHKAGGIGWDPRKPEDGPLGEGAVFEGPFGDHTGFYSMPDRYPIIEVTAITHRSSAIYPTTIVGLPPQEDYYLGKATERLFFPLLKTIVHDVEDYDLPQFGAFHNCAAIRIKKAYPLQARRMMHSVWGAGQMAWTKCVIVVDDDVNVHDTFAVLRAVGERCIPGAISSTPRARSTSSTTPRRSLAPAARSASTRHARPSTLRSTVTSKGSQANCARQATSPPPPPTPPAPSKPASSRSTACSTHACPTNSAATGCSSAPQRRPRAMARRSSRRSAPRPTTWQSRDGRS
ncbi:MAG: UbiD family decarboxylase [Phycisphaerales bacterium]